MNHSFFNHSSVNYHLGFFHVLGTVNSAAMNIGVHVSFSVLVSLGYMSSSEIPGSYGGFTASFFLRDHHPVFHSGCINLHPTNSARRFPFLHTLSSVYCFVLFFLMMAILTGVR